MKLAHIALKVSDLERSIAFYSKLGFELKEKIELEKFSSTIAFLKAKEGGAELELVYNWKEKAEPGSQQGFLHLGIEVEDLEQFIKELEEKGIAVSCQPFETPDGTKICFISDPDGYEIELIQPKEK